MDDDDDDNLRFEIWATAVMGAVALVLVVLYMLTIPAKAQDSLTSSEVFKVSIPLTCRRTPGASEAVLSKDHKEAIVGFGIASSERAIVSFFRSESGDTWTILMRVPTGETCLLTSGSSWRSVPWQAESIPN